MEERVASVDEWEKRCTELENLIGPFRDELEAYEAERKALAQSKEAAEGEAKKLADKYAQLVGHQNPKQRIHHVIQLKETIQGLKKVSGIPLTALKSQTPEEHKMDRIRPGTLEFRVN